MFETESRPSVANIVTAAVTCTVMAVLAGIFASRIAIQTVIFFEGIIVFTFAFVMFFLLRVRWKLRFEGEKLYLTNLFNHKEYVVWNTPVNDCIMKRTSEKRDRGTLIIKDTIFRIGNIQNFSAMEAYIRENFPAKRHLHEEND